VQHRGVTIPESFPRGGPLVRIPRRLAWLVVRPYLDSMLRQLTEEIASLRSDLIATNNRISWLEDERDKARGATS
jgi:formylmethanofuran dehydrogenase subunit A